ncbi:hypothetical protein J6590_037021 [Homalodisca vitripennis]|nr:hypothetical protein J6590_037021 [Homalodisca vitripennis]
MLRVQIGLVCTFQLNIHWVQQKIDVYLNLDNLMDVQERHITNRKCRDSGLQRRDENCDRTETFSKDIEIVQVGAIEKPAIHAYR